MSKGEQISLAQRLDEQFESNVRFVMDKWPVEKITAIRDSWMRFWVNPHGPNPLNHDMVKACYLITIMDEAIRRSQNDNAIDADNPEGT